MLAAVALVGGALLGWLCGGSLRGVEHIQLRFGWLLLLLFVVQGVARGRIAGASATSAGLIVWIVSCVLLVAVLLPNFRTPGVWLAIVGLILNLLVVLLNGGMPVFSATVGSTAEAVSAVAKSSGFYQVAGQATIATLLADVLPLTVGRTRILLSSGDVLLVVGVVSLMVSAMLAPSVELRD